MPDIAFNCPHCQQSIEAPDEMSGILTVCPSCRKDVQVPREMSKVKQAGDTTDQTEETTIAPSQDYVSATCPTCGAGLQVLANKESVVCGYCGNAISAHLLQPQSQPQQPVNHAGGSGFRSEIDCQFCLEDGRYVKAFGKCILCGKACCTLHGDGDVGHERLSRELHMDMSLKNRLLIPVWRSITSSLGGKVTCNKCCAAAIADVVSKTELPPPVIRVRTEQATWVGEPVAAYSDIQLSTAPLSASQTKISEKVSLPRACGIAFLVFALFGLLGIVLRPSEKSPSLSPSTPSTTDIAASQLPSSATPTEERIEELKGLTSPPLPSSAPSEIENIYKAATARDPKGMCKLGDCYAKGLGMPKNADLAVRWYKMSAEAGDPTAMSNLGAAYAKGFGVLKDDAEAMKWYRMAADHGNADAIDVLRARGEVKKVAIDLNQADTAQAHIDRGLEFSKNQQWKNAIAECTKALEIDPQNAIAYNNRGYFYIVQHRYDLALKDCNKALQLKPDFVRALHNRASIYFETRHYSDAVTDYTKILEIDQKNSIARLRRAFAYANLGKLNRAITDCRMVMMEGDVDQAAQARQLLARCQDGLQQVINQRGGFSNDD